MYGAVPLAGATVAEPVAAPWHNTFAWALIEAVNWATSVITTEAAAVHPLASVAVTLYVPAVRFVAVAVVWPFDHKYVIEPVPPLPVAVAVPSEPPKQETLVWVVVTDTAVAGWVIVVLEVWVQPLASVTVTV